MAGTSVARTWRPSRRLAFVGAGAVGVAGLSATGAAVAGLDALVRVRPRPSAPIAHVVATRPSDVPGCTTVVTLTGPGAAEAGWVGLATDHGRLLAGPASRSPRAHANGTAGHWDRHAVALPGAPASSLQPGQSVSVSTTPWEGCDDPFGAGSRSARVPTEHGDLTVTIAGPDGTRRAVVFVHGRGGHRTSGWWLAPTCAEAGWRTVMPAYRNSADGGPLTGRYLLGGEWADLAAVLDWLAPTVDEVVLVGWSMGGNICASYLRQRHRNPERFAHQPKPVGLVLDAAALDWRKVLVHVARARRLPHRLVPLAMAVGRLGRRIDWHDLDHLTDPDHLGLPVLAFHGEADDVVPCELSETLAARLPHVELELVAGAGHCRSVNVDPGRYLTALRRLLDTT